MENVELIEKLDQITSGLKMMDDYASAIDSLESKYEEKKEIERDIFLNQLETKIKDIKGGMGLISPELPFDFSGTNTTAEDILRKFSQSDEFSVTSEALHKAIADYDEKHKSFVTQYDSEYDLAEKAFQAKLHEYAQEWSQEELWYNNKIDTIKAELDDLDILHKDYYYLADDIATILKTRRANSLTDALNLAIKEEEEREYREKLLQIQEDEAEERNQILRDQAENNRRFNEEMAAHQREQLESQRRAEAYAARQAEAAENQTKILKQQAKAAEEAQRDAKREAEYRRRQFLSYQADFDKWSRAYESASKQGLTKDAATYKRYMEQAQAKMLEWK